MPRKPLPCAAFFLKGATSTSEERAAISKLQLKTDAVRVVPNDPLHGRDTIHTADFTCAVDCMDVPEGARSLPYLPAQWA